MPTFAKLPSGRWRAQVRKNGASQSKVFDRKADAATWAAGIESKAASVAVHGYAPVPAGATVGTLIDAYIKATPEGGKTKTSTLAMLRRELGAVPLRSLSALTLSGFIDDREAMGAGGVTIAADLSFLSAILKWARHARRWDVPERLALEARASLQYRGLHTRSTERDREPTDDELERLYTYWANNPRLRLPMEDICRFALASGMRLGEIAGLQIEDIDPSVPSVVIRDRKDPRHKAGNDQEVPLLPEAWVIVQRHIAGRDEGQVFQHVKADSVSTSFTRACALLGIKDLHFHDLRHRACADLFRMGLDIPRVALMERAQDMDHVAPIHLNQTR